MDFEYGCSTVNKFAFLDENEVEDPSDLLTQAQTAATKKETTKGKDAKGKDARGKKPAGKTDTKQPLKASDNAVKKTFDNKDGTNNLKPFLVTMVTTMLTKDAPFSALLPWQPPLINKFNN